MRRHNKQINIEGDVVIIYYQDEPTVYARIEAIEPDVKQDWYRVTFLMLTIPSQTATWILREEYINGSPFTMGGRPLRIEGVERTAQPSKITDEGKPGVENNPDNQGSKVIPLRKNKS